MIPACKHEDTSTQGKINQFRYMIGRVYYIVLKADPYEACPESIPPF